jgi:hypothetical protein
VIESGQGRTAGRRGAPATPPFSGGLDLEQPDQYRATMMMAATSNTAISESVRSSDFDRDFVASIGGMA